MDTPARTLHVGMDLDGVAVMFDRAYVHGCVIEGILPPADYPPATDWLFYERLGQDLSEFLANCHRLADVGLLWDYPPVPGTATAWNAIVDAGHQLHVKTDRAFGSHPAVSESATRGWLRRYQLRHHSVTFGPNKTAGPRTDVMVEDRLDNYDALEAAGVVAYLMDRPWNQPETPEDLSHAGRPRRRIAHLTEFADAALTMGASLV